MKNILIILAAALAVACLGGCLGPGYQAPDTVREYTTLTDQHGNRLEFQTKPLYHMTYAEVAAAFAREFPDTYKHAKETPNISTVVYTDAHYRVRRVTVEGDWVVPPTKSADGQLALVVVPTLEQIEQQNCP